ncbi:DUF4136 domain-containing protein [uncultured Pontibacter sp.]|uniref:DUF4136 domain-containing protein n=1 Tax=uncultured Pontibacter sp. TaxID=453356 RepID=UPI00262E42D7|nr:DUF4136 domain-containing protein [uncultured Pontibacter sp.]
MKFKKKQFILAGILYLLVAACSPIRVLDTEADEGFKLSNYKTFDFYEVDASGDALGPYTSQLDYLKKEITQQLMQQGLQQDAAAPDLKVNLGIVIAEKVQTRETNILTDPPYYMGQRRYTWKSREVEVGRYQQGTLSLHLVDNARNELMWQGAAEGVVPDDNVAKLQKRISEGVQKLVDEIPK